MLKFKLYLNLVLSFLLIAGSIPAQALSPTTSALVQKNYLSNGGFENGPVGFKTYKNAAQATPVTGLGGTPATTMTTTTLTPIADKTSALFTHTASNLQGEGVALSFALEPRAKAKLLTISGDYQIVSGTYSGGTGLPTITDSDVEVYVYDVDAGQIIQPAAYRLDGGVIGQMYSISATFQSNASSTNYRLIFHNATTTTSAFQLKIDNLSVSRVNAASGSITTDWAPYTATFGGFGTVSTQSLWWKRTGDSIQIRGTFTSGVVTAVLASISLPNSYVTSNSLLNATTNVIGKWNSDAQSATFFSSGTILTGQGYSTVLFGLETSSSHGTQSQNGSSLAGSVYSVFTEPIPIQGFSSNVQAAADSGEGRVVAARISASGTSLTFNTSTPTLVFPTVEADTHNAYNSSTGTYTVPVSGYYQIDAQSFLIGSNFTANCSLSVNVYRNGINVGYASQLRLSNNSTITIFNPQFSGSTKFFFNAGDQITFRGYSDVTATSTSGLATGNNISISRLSANSQILAGESVNARYTNSSGQSLANGASTSIAGWTKVKDSHGAFNASTGVYTIPVSGAYRVSFRAGVVAAASSLGNMLVGINQSGSSGTSSASLIPFPQAGYTIAPQVSDLFQCIAGDQISLVVYQNNGSALNLSTNSAYNGFSIEKVGN